MSRQKQKPAVVSEVVAFVLCHPIENSMNPIFAELPACLFPVCNMPAVYYVIHWLKFHNISRIFLLCPTKDYSQIEASLRDLTSKILQNVNYIQTDERLFSIGSCISFIDRWNSEKREIKSDSWTSIIVPSTLITNVNLNQSLSEHMSRQEQKTRKTTPLLTTIFTQNDSGNYLILMNRENQILKIQKTSEDCFNFSLQSLQLPSSLFTSDSQVFLKNQISDSEIYICQSQLLANFQDELVWQNVLDHCIPSMLKTFEMTGDTAHASIQPNAFSTNVNSLPNYILANHAVLRRWLYPITVEVNELCHVSRDYIHIAQDVLPSLKSLLKHSVLIGSKSIPSDNCVIENSVIGSNCTIGEGCVIKNSVIWDSVKIGKGAVLEYCVIASHSVVADYVKISFGCIVSFNCYLDSDLPRCRRLTSKTSIDPKGFLIADEYFTNFQEQENIPRWLSNYINSREELPEGSKTFEYIPFPLQEIPLLQLWNYLSPDDFPIEPQDVADDSNPEDDLILEDLEDQEENPFSLDQDFQVEATQFLVNCLQTETDFQMLQKEFQALMSTREHWNNWIVVLQ